MLTALDLLAPLGQMEMDHAQHCENSPRIDPGGRAPTCARHRSRERSNVVPMRLSLRLLLSIGVVLLAEPECSREPVPAPPAGSATARPPAETPLAGELGSTTRGEIAGVR